MPMTYGTKLATTSIVSLLLGLGVSLFLFCPKTSFGPQTVTISSCKITSVQPIGLEPILGNDTDTLTWSTQDNVGYNIIFPQPLKRKTGYPNSATGSPFSTNPIPVPPNGSSQAVTPHVQFPNGTRHQYYAYSIYYQGQSTPCYDPGLHIIK
jgi:hypothetical protein